MKIKEGFILREIAGSFVVVPVGDDTVDFSSMITTNETGAFLWNSLTEDKIESELCDLLMTEYEGAGREEIEADVREFVANLTEAGVLE